LDYRYFKEEVDSKNTNGYDDNEREIDSFHFDLYPSYSGLDIRLSSVEAQLFITAKLTRLADLSALVLT